MKMVFCRQDDGRYAIAKGDRIVGPVSFLTNDDGHVFPVSTSNPRAAQALNTPLHRKIMAKIIGGTTGARGGDHKKYVAHFAELHKDEARGKTHEEFANHLEAQIKEHSGNDDLGMALRAELREEAKVHVEVAEGQGKRPSLAEHGITVVSTKTTPTKPGKEPRDVWQVSTLTPAWDEELRAMGGARFGRKWSFWEDPTEKLQTMVATARPTRFAEQLEAKQARAADRADMAAGHEQNARDHAQSQYDQMRSIGSQRQLGQPVLVGHHSEGRARRDQQRMVTAMDKVVEEKQREAEWKARSEAALRTAEGRDGDIGYLQRQIKKSEASIRSFERSRDGWDTPPDRKARLDLLIQHERERVDHYQDKLREAGGVKDSPRNPSVSSLLRQAVQNQPAGNAHAGAADVNASPTVPAGKRAATKPRARSERAEPSEALSVPSMKTPVPGADHIDEAINTMGLGYPSHVTEASDVWGDERVAQSYAMTPEYLENVVRPTLREAYKTAVVKPSWSTSDQHSARVRKMGTALLKLLNL